MVSNKRFWLYLLKFQLYYNSHTTRHCFSVFRWAVRRMVLKFNLEGIIYSIIYTVFFCKSSRKDYNNRYTHIPNNSVQNEIRKTKRIQWKWEIKYAKHKDHSVTESYSYMIYTTSWHLEGKKGSKWVYITSPYILEPRWKHSKFYRQTLLYHWILKI